MPRFRNGMIVLTFVLFLLMALSLPVQAQSTATPNPINHIIVVYMENWSFDSLYGLFPGANGIDNAANAAPQVDKTGKVYDTLPAPLNSNNRDSNGKAQPDTRFPANLPN